MSAAAILAVLSAAASPRSVSSAPGVQASSQGTPTGAEDGAGSASFGGLLGLALAGHGQDDTPTTLAPHRESKTSTGAPASNALTAARPAASAKIDLTGSVLAPSTAPSAAADPTLTSTGQTEPGAAKPQPRGTVAPPETKPSSAAAAAMPQEGVLAAPLPADGPPSASKVESGPQPIPTSAAPSLDAPTIAPITGDPSLSAKAGAATGIPTAPRLEAATTPPTPQAPRAEAAKPSTRPATQAPLAGPAELQPATLAALSGPAFTASTPATRHEPAQTPPAPASAPAASSPAVPPTEPSRAAPPAETTASPVQGRPASAVTTFTAPLAAATPATIATDPAKTPKTAASVGRPSAAPPPALGLANQVKTPPVATSASTASDDAAVMTETFDEPVQAPRADRPAPGRPAWAADRSSPSSSGGSSASAAPPSSSPSPTSPTTGVVPLQQGAPVLVAQAPAAFTAEIAMDAAVPAEAAGEVAPEALQPAAERAQAAPSEQILGGSHLSRASVETTALLAARILQKLDQRSTRFDMALTPEGLGTVDVSLDIDADGQLAARLAFDNPAAAAELRGRVDELRRQLEAAGFTVADDGLDFSSREDGSGQASNPFDRDGRSGSRRAFIGAGRVVEAADAAPPPSWISLRLTPEGVDVKV